MHYFKFNWKDYIADTHSMSFVQHGAYIKLMGEYYRGEVPLPLNMEEVHDLVAPRSEEENNAIKYILKRFFIETEAGYVQKRAMAEIQDFKANGEKRSMASRTRWDKEKKTKDVGSDASAMQVQSKCNANNKPVTINNKQNTDTPEGVKESVWKDFKKLRAAKRAPVTDTALEGLAREAAKAGKTLEQALAICVERGWSGFKAEWILKDEPVASAGQKLTDRRVI